MSSSQEEELFVCSQKRFIARHNITDSQGSYMESQSDDVPNNIPITLTPPEGYYSGILNNDPMFLLPHSQGSMSLSQQEALETKDSLSGFNLSFDLANDVGNSFSQNHSFEFAEFDDELQELSQGTQADGYGAGAFIAGTAADTPPLSEEAIEREEPYQFENEFPVLGLKIENDYHVQEADGRVSAEVNRIQEHANSYETEDTSQDESQGARIPDLSIFPGKWNFSMVPCDVSVKKCVFLPEIKKIYCADNHPISFEIKLDFTEVNYRKLSIQAMVYYTANSLILTKGVRQCNRCSDLETRSTNGMPPLDQYGKDLGGWLVRCDSRKAEYSIKRGIHKCVTAPLEKLQPGANSIKRNYKFSCMNSCHVKTEKEAKLWTLVFYLMDGTKELGRDTYNLKICKCPRRDSTRDYNRIHLVKTQTAALVSSSSSTIPPKIEQPSIKTENNFEGPYPQTPPKRARFSEDFDADEEYGRVAVAEIGAVNNSPRPGPSRLANMPDQSGSSTNTSRKMKRCAPTGDNDDEPLSQDDFSQIGDGLITKIKSSVELALAYKRHPNEVYNKFARNWMKQLYYMNEQMAFYRDHVVVEANLPEECEDGDAENDENEEDEGPQN